MAEEYLLGYARDDPKKIETLRKAIEAIAKQVKIDVVFRSGTSLQHMQALEGIITRLGMPEIPPPPEKFLKVAAEVEEGFNREKREKKLMLSGFLKAAIIVAEQVYKTFPQADLTFDPQEYAKRVAEIVYIGISHFVEDYMLRRRGVHQESEIYEFAKEVNSQIQSRLQNFLNSQNELGEIAKLVERVKSHGHEIIVFWAYNYIIDPILREVVKKLDNKENFAASYTVLEVLNLYLERFHNNYD